MAKEKQSARSWQEIAQEAGKEHDPDKLLKLSEELERALDDRAKSLQSQKLPERKKQAG